MGVWARQDCSAAAAGSHARVDTSARIPPGASLLLTALLIATGLSAVTTPFAGHISDLIGHKRMYLIGAVVMGLYSFIYFALLNTAIPAVIFIAIILSFIPHDMMYGPQAALIAECFGPRLRYSGSSLGYHLASVVAGGPAPIIATALLAATGSGYSVALYIFACAVVSVVTTAMLPDYTNQDISQEAAYDSLADPAVKARWRADPAGEPEHRGCVF